MTADAYLSDTSPPYDTGGFSTSLPPRFATAALLLLAAAWLVIVCVFTWHYIEDDSFIHLEFAKNIFAGKGYAFQGHVTYGNSSPLWPILISAIYGVVKDWVIAIKVMAWFGAIVCVSGIFALSTGITRKFVLPWIVPFIVVPLLIINPYFIFWVFSGMEAVMALGIAFWLAWLAGIAQPTARRWVLIGILSGLGPLVRAELVLLAGLCFLVALMRSFAPSNRARFAQPLLWAVVAGIVAIVPLVAWGMYAKRTFGHVIPNTNAAKRILDNKPVTYATGVIRLAKLTGIGFGFDALLSVAGVMVIATRGWPVRRVSGRYSSSPPTQPPGLADRINRKGVFLISIGWPVVLGLFYLANKTAVQTRYFLICAPFLTLFGVAMCSMWALAHPPGSLARKVCALAFALCIFAPIAIDTLSVQPHLRNKANNVLATHAFCERIREVVPPTDPIGVYAFGQFAFELPNPVVDMGGLVQPEGQPYLTDLPKMIDWATRKGARYFVAPSADTAFSTLPEVFTLSQPVMGWSFSRSWYDQPDTRSLRRAMPSNATTSPDAPTTP